MKRLMWPLALVMVPAILGGAGLIVSHGALPSLSAPSEKITTQRPALPSPKPTDTKPPAKQVGDTARPTVTPRHSTRPRRRRSDAWSVVSAYYRDVTSHRYAEAWALIRLGLTTGQTYHQFVAGYACTGSEQPTELSQSGNQVSFSLTVVNDCNGSSQHYSGTDTVRGGRIIAADVTPTD